MNKARMKCLTGMVIALLQAKSVSLSRLSALFPGKAKIESCQRRMHRFIREVRIDYDLLAEFIMSLFDFADKEIYLTLDRTNWKLGKKNINFLVLGVVYQGAAIQIVAKGLSL